MSKKIVILNTEDENSKDIFIKYVSKYVSTVCFSNCVEGFVSSSNNYSTRIMEVINKFEESDNYLLFIDLNQTDKIEILINQFNIKSLLIKSDKSSSIPLYNYDYIIYGGSLKKLNIQALYFTSSLRDEESAIKSLIKY